MILNITLARQTDEEVLLGVVDIDHLIDDQLEAAIASLAPYQQITHASRSDRHAGCTICTCGGEPGVLHGQSWPSRVDRCVRAMIVLSRPVTRGEWPRFWRAAMAQLNRPVDPLCCPTDCTLCGSESGAKGEA